MHAFAFSFWNEECTDAAEQQPAHYLRQRQGHVDSQYCLLSMLIGRTTFYLQLMLVNKNPFLHIPNSFFLANKWKDKTYMARLFQI